VFTIPTMVPELEGVWPTKARCSNMTVLQRVPGLGGRTFMLPLNALIKHRERLILWQEDLTALYATKIRHPRSEVQYIIEGLL
jgi:hypothetical protein